MALHVTCTTLHSLYLLQYLTASYSLCLQTLHSLYLYGIPCTCMVLSVPVTHCPFLEPTCHSIHCTCVAFIVPVRHSLYLCGIYCSCVTFLVPVWHSLYLCDIPCTCVTFPVPVWHSLYLCDIPCTCVAFPVPVWHSLYLCDIPCTYFPLLWIQSQQQGLVILTFLLLHLFLLLFTGWWLRLEGLPTMHTLLVRTEPLPSSLHSDDISTYR